MKAETLTVPVEKIRQVAERSLVNHGAPPRHAEIQVDLLIEAELRDFPSHGLLRLPRIVQRIVNGVADPVASGKHRWVGTGRLDVDGQGGLGPVVALAALNAMLDRARDHGVAVCAIANNNHLGMLAWYAEWAAMRGFTAICLTTSEALVHPWGGRQAMIGTNPIAIGVPASPSPFVVDVATSAVSMGKIHDHALRGQPIPHGWALDRDGRDTTDAEEAKKGALAPFGGAKGYALGLAFEVLIGALVDCELGDAVHGTLDADRRCNKGDLFILIDSKRGSAVGQTLARYLDEIRASAPRDGVASVAVPGDRSRRCREQRLRDGIAIVEATWRDLQSLAGRDNALPRRSGS